MVSLPMDKDSCDTKQPHNGFPAEGLVERHAGPSLGERFIHCTWVWSLWQVSSRQAVPTVELMG